MSKPTTADHIVKVNKMVSTAKCIEWLDKQISWSSHRENEMFFTIIRAKLLAADEMAKALDNTVNISAICHPQVARGEYLIDKKTMQQNAKSLTDYRNAGGK